MEQEQHIRTWIERTTTRLQEIDASPESRSEKLARASMNVGFLLCEVIATVFPGETETQMQRLVALYLNIGQ